MALLEVRNICKQYSGFDLRGINISLDSGYIFGYVGPNGAGKTTTLDIITGLRKPSSGEVLIGGIKCTDDPVKYRESIGYVGDSSYFPENFTRRDVRSVLADFYSSFDRERYDALCDGWNLPQKEKIKTWSRGMKVKLMFASVLSRKTKLLVLDEATNGLDPIMRRDILHMLQDYIADGEHSVIFSTHIMEDLEDIADYIYIINGGREVVSGSRDDLKERFLLVKGTEQQLREVKGQALRGVVKNGYGFEALFDTEAGLNLPDGGCLDKSFPGGMLVETPSIDQLVLHLL